MLKKLELNAVGPAQQIAIDFAKRLNIITGDNGLGKSFLLDIAWWALTRTWAHQPAMPTPAASHAPSIRFEFDGKSGKVTEKCSFDRSNQGWKRPTGRPAMPGLVLYAQVDGGFSVWDPHRNYWKPAKGQADPGRPKSYIFKPDEVWQGLELEEGKIVCNGLLADWASWQRENGETFAQLCRVLQVLSPSREEALRPGPLTRISIDDARDYPTLATSYGQNIPVVHASAGVRRIIALAYLLVWSWREHLIASELLGSEPAHQIIFLIDEIESHLHPKWQRQIFKALLEVMEALVGNKKIRNIQIISATHSPLVLASLEPLFDPRKDALFDLDLVSSDATAVPEVVIKRMPWERLGTADRWLISNVFNLKSARSIEAETVIDELTQAMKSDALTPEQARRLDDRLGKVLGETDPLWARWHYVARKKGWLPPESIVEAAE